MSSSNEVTGFDQQNRPQSRLKGSLMTLQRVDILRRRFMAVALGLIGSGLLPKLSLAQTESKAKTRSSKKNDNPRLVRQRWWPDYQPRDYEVLDYERFYVDGCVDVPFRGPPLNPFHAEPGSFFTCLGASQTYGVLSVKPYPLLLSHSLGMPALNLGVGGAGPAFYTQYDRLIEAINSSRFVILQCMSARDTGHSRFKPDGFVGYVRDGKTGDSLPSVIAWRRLVVEEPENAVRYVEEARRSWIDQSMSLLARIKVPVIFFYYSRRPSDYRIDKAAIQAQIKDIRAGKE